MSSYYTNVITNSNQILIREINNGQRINRKFSFKPTFFVKSNKPKSKYHTLAGEPVEPIEFDSIKESREWVKTYENVPDYPLYGNTFHNYSWISENYPHKLEYNFKELGVYSLDIEVEAENGFPTLEVCGERINLITFKNINTQEVYSYGLPYSHQRYKTSRKNVHYEAFASEQEMCVAFLNKWAEVQPDILIGWNISFFDVPYLVKRMFFLLGEDSVKKALSPWGKVNERSIKFYGQEKPSYDIDGVSILDYYRLYRKYVFEPRENYKLGFIAEEELGLGKIDHGEYATFSEFYKKDWQKYVDYNIRDVELVEALDKKLKLIELVLMVAYRAKVNYEDVLSQTRVWDMLLFNYLKEKNVVIPFKVEHHKDQQYEGAYVKEPKPGLYKWIVSLDFTSLYPSIMRCCNHGFETKIDKRFDINQKSMLAGNVCEELQFCKDNNYTLSANGTVYSKDKKSVYSELLEELFNLRVEYKNKLKEAKKSGNKELESKFDISQQAVKIILNSMYGACGSEYFRFYDIDVASAVTTTGQVIIQYVEREINRFLNESLKTKNITYIIYADTDSQYISLDKLIQTILPNEKNNDKIVTYIDKFTNNILQPKISECCEYICNNLINGMDPNLLKMNREVIADKCIWTGKKRYILNVLDNEGIRLEKPKIKMKGIEAVKSVIPKFSRDKLKEAIKIILSTDDNNKIIDFIEKTKKEFKKLPAYEISIPKGCNGLVQYGDAKSIYGKKCPLHVRGSLLYNHYLKKNNLIKKYQFIQEGEKIRYIYLRVPNTIRENVISFNGDLPEEFGLNDYIDWDLQFEKIFLDPLNIILKAIKWNSERVANLDRWL